MPRLKALGMRIGLERPVHAAGHLGGMVGIVGARAIDRGGPAHRRQEFGARERQGFDAAFSSRRGRFPQHAFRRSPVLEDAEDRRVGALAREVGGIEYLAVDDQPSARAIRGLVSRELVPSHSVCSVTCHAARKSFCRICRSCRGAGDGLSLKSKGEMMYGSASDGRITKGENAMIKPRRIGHATFDTPDLEKAIAYYGEFMGLVLAEREKDRAFLAGKIGQLLIELKRADRAHCTNLSFEVAPNSDFGELAR